MDTSTLQAGDRIPMSWEEYEALGPEVRGEYIDGALVVSPLASGRHQDICQRLCQLLIEACPSGMWARQSWGWKPAADEFGPDVMVYDQIPDDRRFTGTPHLVVEVLSTDRGADLVRKYRKYAEAGVPRYWVIDPDGPEIFVFQLEPAGGFNQTARFGPDEQVDLAVGSVRVRFRAADLLV
jgi:Uma2 family endonuclease